MTRSAYRKKTDSVWVTEMDEALAADPPLIEWRSNGKGIVIAISIHDPHTKDRKRGKAA